MLRRDKEEDEKKDLVVQEPLRLLSGARVHKLRDVNMRPHPSGRKSQGTLEIQANGVRYTSNKGERIDVVRARRRRTGARAGGGCAARPFAVAVIPPPPGLPTTAGSPARAAGCWLECPRASRALPSLRARAQVFKNMQNCFFQPAQKEHLVLLHFHLHDGIMVSSPRPRRPLRRSAAAHTRLCPPARSAARL